MVTKNKIAFDIAMDLGRDTDLDFIEQLKFEIDVFRARLIRQDIERNASSREHLKAITLQAEPVDVADSCYVDIGCDIYRTSVKVPLPLRQKGVSAFRYVGPVRIALNTPIPLVPFTYIEPESIMFLKYDKRINKNYPLYTYVNGYLYFYHFTGTRVLIEDPFTDPMSAVLMDLCASSVSCYNDDEPYPLAADLVPILKRMILEEKFNVVARGLNRNLEVPVDEVPTQQ